MTSMTMVMTTIALIGVEIAPVSGLATLPLALQLAVTKATAIPATLFMRRFGRMHIHVWRPIDSRFRLITARRNPNMVLLVGALLFGRPDVGIELVANQNCFGHLAAWLRLPRYRPLATAPLRDAAALGDLGGSAAALASYLLFEPDFVNALIERRQSEKSAVKLARAFNHG